MKYQRTLVIGDIHGSIHALNDALCAAQFNIKEDRIICIGDYVDGWDYSYEVVQRLLTIKNNSPFENIFILGNHDRWFKRVIYEDFEQFRNKEFIKIKYNNWYIQGGRETRNSYLSRSDDEIRYHKSAFFDNLKLFHVEDNKLFVHAGYNMALGFKGTVEHSKKDLIWDRDLYKMALNKYRSNLELQKKGMKTVDFKIGEFDKIYLGHSQTSSDGLDTPRVMGNVINVDQGCKKREVLSIWIDETDTFYQSDQI